MVFIQIYLIEFYCSNFPMFEVPSPTGYLWRHIKVCHDDDESRLLNDWSMKVVNPLFGLRSFICYRQDLKLQSSDDHYTMIYIAIMRSKLFFVPLGSLRLGNKSLILSSKQDLFNNLINDKKKSISLWIFNPALMSLHPPSSSTLIENLVVNKNQRIR